MDIDYATNPEHLTQRVIDAIDEGILVLFRLEIAEHDVPNPKCKENNMNDVGPNHSIWGAAGQHLVMTVGAANINEEFVGYSSQGPAQNPTKPDFCSITHFAGFSSVDTGKSVLHQSLQE